MGEKLGNPAGRYPFYPVGETIPLSEGQTYEVKNNFRRRYVTEYAELHDAYEWFEDTEKRLFDLIEPTYSIYLLANVYADPHPSSCYWGVEAVCFENESEEEGFPGKFSRSRFRENRLEGHVRPVICLKSNITPTLKSTDSTTGISTYEI